MKIIVRGKLVNFLIKFYLKFKKEWNVRRYILNFVLCFFCGRVNDGYIFIGGRSFLFFIRVVFVNVFVKNVCENFSFCYWCFKNVWIRRLKEYKLGLYMFIVCVNIKLER